MDKDFYRYMQKLSIAVADLSTTSMHIECKKKDLKNFEILETKLKEEVKSLSGEFQKMKGIYENGIHDEVR